MLLTVLFLYSVKIQYKFGFQYHIGSHEGHTMDITNLVPRPPPRLLNYLAAPAFLHGCKIKLSLGGGLGTEVRTSLHKSSIDVIANLLMTCMEELIL